MAETTLTREALALVERMLPGWDINLSRETGFGWECNLQHWPDGNSKNAIVIDAIRPTAPLAIISALLAALQAIGDKP